MQYELQVHLAIHEAVNSVITFNMMHQINCIFDILLVFYWSNMYFAEYGG